MMVSFILTLIVLILVNSWPLTIGALFASLPFLATMLYKPILSPMFSTPYLVSDNLSISLVMLTVWVTALGLTSGSYILHWHLASMKFRRLVVTLCLILVMAFLVTNLLSFYILFEAALFPILLIILIWGSSPERLQASVYLVLYTVCASLPLLAMILLMYKDTYSLFMFFQYNTVSTPMMILMSLAFLVKFPMYGMHMWLPKAHVEAPVTGSMLLAGVLLKLGPYGMMRLMMMFPKYSVLGPVWVTWGLLGGIAAGIVCIRQTDMKSLVAYASVSHMGLTLAGLMSYTNLGWWGASLMLLGHGLASSGLFAMVSAIYEWTHSRSLIVNRGVYHAAPALGLFMFLLVAANMGVPPTLNMAGEVLMFSGIVAVDTEVPVMCLMLIVFSVVSMLYSLTLYTNLTHGPVTPHVNFIWQRPIYFTIAFLHLAPLIGGFFCMSVLI